MMKTKTLYVLFNFILFINQRASFKIPTTSNCNLTLLEEEDDHQITDTSSEFLIYILDISNSRDQKFKTENSDLFLPQRWYSVKNIDLMQQLQLLYSVYTSIFKSVYQSKFRELSVNATPSGCFYNLNDDELENVARTFFWKEVQDGNDYICSAHVSQEDGVGYLFFRCCHQTDFQNYDCVDIKQKNYLFWMYLPSLIIALLTFIFFAYKLFHNMLKYPILSSKRCCQCIKDINTFDFYPKNLKLTWTVENKMAPNNDHKWIIGNATKEEWDSYIKIENGESVTVKAIKLRVKRKNTIEKGRKLMDVFENIKYLVNSNCCKSCIYSFYKSCIYSYYKSCIYSYYKSCIYSCCKSCICSYCKSCIYSYYMSCICSYCKSCIYSCCKSCIYSCCKSCIYSYYMSCIYSYYKSCKCGLCHILLYLIWLSINIFTLIPLCFTLNNKDEIPCEVYKQKNLTCSDNIYKEDRVSLFLKVYTVIFILFFIILGVLKCFGNSKNFAVIFCSYLVTVLSTISCCIFVHFIIYFMMRFVFTCIMSGDPTSNVTLFSLPIVCIIIVIFSKNNTDTLVEDIVKLHKEAKFIYSRKCINVNEAVTFTLGQDKWFIGQLYFQSNKLVFQVNRPLIFLRKDGEFYISKKFVCAPFPDMRKKSAWEYNKILTKIILSMGFFVFLVVAYIKLNTFYSRSSTFVSWVGYAALAIQKLGMFFSTSYNQQEREYNYQLLEDYKNIYGTYSESWTVTNLITESYSSAENSNQSTNQTNPGGSKPGSDPTSSSQTSPVDGTSTNQSNTGIIEEESNSSSSLQISPVAGTSTNQTNDDNHSRKQTVLIEMENPTDFQYSTKNEKPKENISSSDIEARATNPKHICYESIEKVTDSKKKAFKNNRTKDEEKQSLLETEETSLNV